MSLAQINKHHGDEVNRRSAVHSSYYAVFHECKLLASALNINLNQQVVDPRNSKRNLTTHQKLAHLLTEYGSEYKNVHIKRIGQSLNGLHTKRCEADYDLDLEVGFSNQEVGKHVLACIQLISLSEKMTAPAKVS